MTKVIIIWILVAVILINKAIAQNCKQVGCDNGLCCSEWGYCGNTPLHCAGGSGQTNGTYNAICQPACQSGSCCSKWGFCGNSPLHCSNGGGSQINNTNGGSCQPPCGSGFCCSRWGFCGNTPLHCSGNGGQTNNTSGNTCQPPCGSNSCCSKWGYCGNSPLHCTGSGTTVPPNTVSPPVTNTRCPPACAPGLCCSTSGYCTSILGDCNTQPTTNNNETTLTRARFNCIFDQLSPALSDQRWQGFQDALALVPFKPQNQDELMMFFAHVSHETDGLKTYEEYCGQSGSCINDYQNSWCPPVQAAPGKYYYGRGWFQLTWPCNYNAAGKALGVDFLKNPEKVAESDALAAATAMWFWNANNMGQPARNGNFGGTTQKINSIECGRTARQDNRIKRYQKVRQCFGLNDATNNLWC